MRQELEKCAEPLYTVPVQLTSQSSSKSESVPKTFQGTLLISRKVSRCGTLHVKSSNANPSSHYLKGGWHSAVRISVHGLIYGRRCHQSLSFQAKRTSPCTVIFPH